MPPKTIPVRDIAAAFRGESPFEKPGEALGPCRPTRKAPVRFSRRTAAALDTPGPRTEMGIIVLPWPPSTNNLTRKTRDGRAMARSCEYKAFKAAVAVALAGRDAPMVEGPVSVSMHFYRPSAAGDLDNRIKVVLDVLQGFAFENDRQVEELRRIRRSIDRQNPRVEVRVQPFLDDGEPL